MTMYNGMPVKFSYRQGTSIARGTTIDEYLTQEQCEALYKLWEQHPEWPEIYRFSGGITAISCEMVLEVPNDDFVKAFKKYNAQGVAMAKAILTVAEANAGR